LVKAITKSNVQHSENIAKQQSLDEQGLHAESASAVSTSSKIGPVNLEMNFAAANLEENKLRLDSRDSPFASNEGIDDTPSKNCKGKVFVKNKFCKKYSTADTWINRNIAKYQWKLSGGEDPLISSSCIQFWNVPPVLFHTRMLQFQLVKTHTPMCAQTQMSGLMVTLFPPLHHWCVTIIIPWSKQL
jgi:hypothetical protein